MTIDLRGSGRLNDSGSVLLLVLLISLVLVGLGLSTMWLSSNSSHVSGSLTRRQEALYAAEMGLERARWQLQNIGNATTLLGTNAGGPCGGSPLDEPAGRGNILCIGSSPTWTPMANTTVGASVTASETPGLSKISYTVFIRNDPAEFAVIANRYNDSDNRVVVRSEGRAQDGSTVVALEAMLIVGAGAGAAGVPDYTQAGQNSRGSNSGLSAIGP